MYDLYLTHCKYPSIDNPYFQVAHYKMEPSELGHQPCAIVLKLKKKRRTKTKKLG
jgi:hypothetical protein